MAKSGKTSFPSTVPFVLTPQSNAKLPLILIQGISIGALSIWPFPACHLGRIQPTGFNPATDVWHV